MRTTVSSVLISSSRDAVWRALTEPELVKRWQYDSQLLTDWRVDSEIRFVTEWSGTTYEQWGTVMAFDAPSHLAYSLFAPRPDLADLPEHYFTMTYDVTPHGGDVLVTIRQIDPRYEPDEGDETEESPVLAALREVAESL